ncbi:MAG: hypothetical protein ACREXI_14820 [Caldimonas sp.]
MSVAVFPVEAQRNATRRRAPLARLLRATCAVFDPDNLDAVATWGAARAGACGAQPVQE